MHEYLIYTTEGETFAPNNSVYIENCQILGRSRGNTFAEALDKLYVENLWIGEAGFDKSKCIGIQIVL